MKILGINLRNIIREELRRSLIQEVDLTDDLGYVFSVNDDGTIVLRSRPTGDPNYGKPAMKLSPARAAKVANILLKQKKNAPGLKKAIDKARQQPVKPADTSGSNDSAGSLGLNKKPGGFVLFAQQEFTPITTAFEKSFGKNSIMVKASQAITSITGQGHGFAVVIDPKTGTGHRFDFGRYDDVAKCANKNPLAVLGITLYHKGTVPAKISKDGMHIENLKEFISGILKSTDTPGAAAVIPVSDPAAALAWAKSTVGTCRPYGIPGISNITLEDDLNCGTFALRVAEMGKPLSATSWIQTLTVFDTPDHLIQQAKNLGYEVIDYKP